jgi:hypothetical protein
VAPRSNCTQLLLISDVRMIGHEEDSNNKTTTTYELCPKPILQMTSTGAAVINYIGFDSQTFRNVVYSNEAVQQQ